VLNNVAKWNGTDWKPVGSGFNAYAAPEVLALGVSNGKLYAGGFFDQSGNITHLLSIAQWEDTAWVPLGRGIGGLVDSSSEDLVSAIDTYQNNLYAGGGFGFAGDDSAQSIAEWNGSKWISIGDSAGGLIQAFQSYKNKLYIGGAGGIIGWDGVHYSNLGSNVNSFVNSLVVFQNSLYVGGQFDTAGGIVANCIARWSPDSTSSIEQITTPNNQLTVSPNPFSQQTTLQFSQPTTNNTQLTLYDLLGMQVENYVIPSGAKNFIIQRNNMPAGMYFYKIQGNGMPPLAGKVVIE
jgi:hypothetical protein